MANNNNIVNKTDLNSESFLEDLRIEGYDPLIPPQILSEDIPLSLESRTTVAKARAEANQIMMSRELSEMYDDSSINTPKYADRVLLICGPCSIHDVDAAMEYGLKLKSLAKRVENEVLILMRAYFEKPRTTIGWKGLINDPFLDNSYQINKGLRIGRKLLCDLTHNGIPVAVELLDTISPQYLGDVISWGAIGARTTESQLHRELASGVSFPIGFKNGTEGNIGIALDAIRAASHPHRFMGVTHQGLAAITRTKGNGSCHVILRGGKTGPNYSKQHVQEAKKLLENASLIPRIMVDCSHGNSQKKFQNQIKVLEDLCDQIRSGDDTVSGIMIESNLVEGNQKMSPDGLDNLVYGKSVTDACVGWDETVRMVEMLQKAVQERRKN